MSQKYHRYLIWTIILLALVLRIVYLLQTKDNPLFFPVNNGLDPSLYHRRAQLISQGVMLSPDFIYGMPFYPYFLALWYRLLGENIFLMRFIQMCLGAINCFFIYLIVKQIFNIRAALISAFIFASYGMFIFYEGLLLGTTLTIFFSCSIMLVLLSIQRKTSLGKWFLLGFLVGLLSLNRASILLFIPFILFWFSCRRAISSGIKFTSQFIFCLTVLLVISPITLRNYLIARDFIPITAHAGINFYVGNNPEADGSFKPPKSMHISLEAFFADSLALAEKRIGKKMRPSEVSRYWLEESVRFIKEKPFAFSRLLLRKTALLFNSYEIYDVVDYSFFRQRFKTILNLPLPNLRLIFPLALLGLFLSLSWKKRCLLLYLLITSYVISILAYFVNARYRLPLVAFLIIFSGFAIDWWLRAYRDKRFKAIIISLAGLTLLFLVTNLNIAQQNYVSEYNNLGVAYKETGKFDLAILAYKEALKINPHLAYTHNNLGNLYNATGEYARAVQELKQAIELDPNLAEAHSNLGIVYTKIGKIEAAVVEYKKAIKLRPNLVTAHYNLGVIYQRKGRLDSACAHFQTALKHAPDYVFAHNNLGVLYLAENELKLAQRHFQEATKLQPEFVQAYYNLGRVYFKQDRFLQARSCWQKVLEIKPDFSPAKERLEQLRNKGY